MGENAQHSTAQAAGASFRSIASCLQLATDVAPRSPTSAAGGDTSLLRRQRNDGLSRVQRIDTATLKRKSKRRAQNLPQRRRVESAYCTRSARKTNDLKESAFTIMKCWPDVILSSVIGLLTDVSSYL